VRKQRLRHTSRIGGQDALPSGGLAGAGRLLESVEAGEAPQSDNNNEQARAAHMSCR
jgi:hypothetical protein